MKTTFISTVFNEEENIGLFIRSILSQTKKPDEIIIVDGGSTDKTVESIKYKVLSIKPRIKLKLFIKPGNRSVGRNEAIKQATGDLILCSDAGCVLDKRWIESITKPFRDKSVDVVAGYYKGKPKSVFEKCLIPYVLVMPDKVNRQTFLPASRSMAFKKSIWEKIGGFPEEFSHNEDYVFARRLKEAKIKIFFQKQALVYWIPRKNIWEAFIMFFRFALGDAQAGILRSKMLFVFGRYLLGIYVLLLSIIEKSALLAYGLIIGIVVYILWTINKNYRYVQDKKALFYLPLLQFVSDVAVLIGTSIGFIRTMNVTKLGKVISGNKSVSFMLVFYIVLMLSIINWGIPNSSHPFTYFMDEWHQAQAVRSVFTHGSPNIAGSANGSMFHFFLSGLYLMPFIALGIVNPFAIKSHIDSLEMQQRLFEVFRLNTLIFGVLSIILITYIAKKYFRLHPFFTVFLFTINPLWLSLSNYFKYDIALIFWIVLSFTFLLRYSLNPTKPNIGLAAFFAGISFSVKVSAFPLLPILIFTVLFFNTQRKENMSHIIGTMFICVTTFSLFGIPDLLFGKGNISEYLYDNLVRTPSYADNYNLGIQYILYLITKGASTVFGYVLFFLSITGTILLMITVLKRKLNHKESKKYVLLFVSIFFFILSLVILKIEARSNRLLVLLPFLALVSGIFIQTIMQSRYVKNVLTIIVSILLGIQLLESIAWTVVKYNADTRELMSNWIIKNVSKGSMIGIENIPIYQALPNIILKEFYNKQYDKKAKTLFSYQVLEGSIALPKYVIVTNEKVALNYVKESSKKALLQRLQKNGYVKLYEEKLNPSSLRFFRDDLDYFMSGLIQTPLSISLYQARH